MYGEALSLRRSRPPLEFPGGGCYFREQDLRGFVGSTHGRYADDFTHLDEERIVLAVDRVRRAHGERTIAAMNANPAGEQLIRAQAGKVKKHLPLRTVFS